MSIAIRPLHSVFAGEVEGRRLHGPLAPEEVAAVEAGMDRYAVLVFRDQDLTDAQQIAFTRHFGELESYNTPGHIRKSAEQRLGAGMADFSNLDKHGNIIAGDDRVWFFKLADRLWHSDSSFRPVPAKYSLLSGRVLPKPSPLGTATPNSPTCAPPTTRSMSVRRQKSSRSSACIRCCYSREAIGFTELTEAETRAFRPVRQRLVRTHPVTGRKSLFLAAHAGAIEGWTVPEAQMFLRDLSEHATQREFVYSHHGGSTTS